VRLLGWLGNRREVKLAGFVFVLWAAALVIDPLIDPLIGQLARSGLRIGGSVAYLTASSDVREPASYIDPDARRLAQLLLSRREQAQAQAKCSGAVPIEIHPDGSATELLSTQAPCVAFETWAEERSSDYAESVQTGFTGIDRTEGKIVLRRFVHDGLRQIYVGYATTVEALPDGTYRVSFGPSTDLPSADVRGKAGWKLLSPAKYPVPQIVRDEDSVRLELYADHPTRKLVDYIHAGREDRMVMRTEAPRDYYAEDAELAMTQPRFRVNGVGSDAVAVLPETIRGPVLWIYVPGHGRYVLSLHAHPEVGFEDAGEAAGNSLTFNVDGNVVRIDTAERVAAGSGIYSVYALPDPRWEPADPQDRSRIMIGAAPGI
jgi:hypothetical protein